MVKTVINTKALPKGTVFRLNSKKSKSDLFNTIFNIGNLIYAINSVAAAFIPPESEKKSIVSPRAKLKISNMLIFFRNGNRKTQAI
jgi:hypothetical protein